MNKIESPQLSRPVQDPDTTIRSWSERWLDVLSLDERAAKRGIIYIYEQLNLPKPQIEFVDGWLECVERIQDRHSNLTDFRVDTLDGRKPDFKIYYRDNRRSPPMINHFLALLCEEITQDWLVSNQVYDLERNVPFTQVMHRLFLELEKNKIRWNQLANVVTRQFIGANGIPAYMNSYTTDFHYLNVKWLHLDATIKAASIMNTTLKMTYNWAAILEFIKAKIFVTYPLNEVVYCVRPPLVVNNNFVFTNGEVYSV